MPRKYGAGNSIPAGQGTKPPVQPASRLQSNCSGIWLQVCHCCLFRTPGMNTPGMSTGPVLTLLLFGNSADPSWEPSWAICK